MICNLKWVRLNLQMPVPELEKALDFVCLNFANGDMVGHRIMAAAQKPWSSWQMCQSNNDSFGSRLYRSCNRRPRQLWNHESWLKSKYGAYYKTCSLFGWQRFERSTRRSFDIVLTILELMGIEKPTVMTQHPLLC
jgi:2,3-bisphosphoglycerate-independent phosphoglycerate mutase